jgi:hypothetical protein
MSALNVSMNMVLKTIFEMKREGATGEREKLDNDEIRNLYISQSICVIIK